MHAILYWGPFSPCRTSHYKILVHRYHYLSRYILYQQTGANSAPVVSYADRPWLAPRVTAISIKAGINGGDAAKLVYCFDIFIHQGNGWYMFDSVVLIIKAKTMLLYFSVSRWCDEKAHIWLYRINMKYNSKGDDCLYNQLWFYLW